MQGDYKLAMWEHHNHRFGLAGEGQADIIQAALEEHSGQVLSIGCGPHGQKVDTLAACCDRLVVADRSHSAIEKVRAQSTRSNVRLVTTDANHLPFADDTFDFVLAFGLFAEIRNPQQVMRELRRVCRSKGQVMLTNAVRHSRDRFRQLAREVGFSVVSEFEGYCPAATGDIKRRYLMILVPKDDDTA